MNTHTQDLSVPNVFTYTDYRTYLRDMIAYRKKQGKPASNRWFAQKVGINSSSWLTIILSGKKGISTKTARNISRALRHTKKQWNYFGILVLFNQARFLEEQNKYFNEMIKLRKSAMIQLLNEEQYAFYTSWYHTAIWSLIDLFPFDGDYERLGLRLSPPITAFQARKAVEMLERIGLIAKDGNGCFVATNRLITSGEDVKRLVTAHFQQETMKLAWEAIDRFPRSERDMSTITVGISKETFEKIKNLAAEFRKQVLIIAREDDAADSVYQCNVQLFPLSLPKKHYEK
jgi:uncharacterized protein (TIGR02147 family)